MDNARLRGILLLEVHRQIAAAAAAAIGKLGKPVPAEAIDGYIDPQELRELQSGRITDLNDPLLGKAMQAAVARSRVLTYPPDGSITATDAHALESLQLTDAQAKVLQRIVAEAAHDAFFHFFALLDSVGAPELTRVPDWQGVGLTYGRTEGPFLHDDFGAAHAEYRRKIVT